MTTTTQGAATLPDTTTWAELQADDEIHLQYASGRTAKWRLISHLGDYSFTPGYCLLRIVVNDGDPEEISVRLDQPIAKTQRAETVTITRPAGEEPMREPIAPTFVPFDADRATLVAYLDASPQWDTPTRGRYITHYALKPGIVAPSSTTIHGVEIPNDDAPQHADEDRELCAEAAIVINAVALGLDPVTPRAAVERLVRIATLSEMKPDQPYPGVITFHRIATGQE